ncbi:MULTISPECIES: ABC transporter ATP-binding protein [Paenibacillus]|jgi:NitT/TauT family transport system ATP-binding protein|uniref:ATP-binding cassette domain-containing protein n=1 Tax=Paenibacillus phytohabitans TaxID=2654978 RepID=A0ABX1YCY8_9BACL|nr:MULTISPECIES: ABC transporter ATP-binding protein [Paenibacillus]AIQ30332.1 spermidine/putrescine ABC transporter ATP-binding protein [Paenibacillus sp. FSL P4-0081]KHL91468.1 spermidine/putrescine ABC transporter ATP-binding protein [Paenibacillus sp. IHB B 3415]NOU77753.1 ATP-binding cassette domain-containing protein [Paenibacillus phytohabitans]
MLPVVELKEITHAYLGDREASLAIEDFNLSVGQGEFVSLVGPSGCGKTTLLSIIAGLLRPSRGEVLLSGRSAAGPSPEVGYMLQQDYLFPWRSIQDNALLGLELTGRLDEESRSKTLQLLADMGLAGKELAFPAQLSGGMRQRVALVRTLATDPGLLLLDEPFSALDYQIKLQLEDLVSETLMRRGTTAILVTHDLSEAIAVSSRVILLQRNPGRIRRIFQVPEAIRSTPPLYARDLPGFAELFHEVWKEMELAGREGV